jgi:hypothetical protein
VARASERPARWRNWDEALEQVQNPALVEFYRAELRSGRANQLRRRVLRFSVGDRRRFIVMARRKVAYVWQRGRFVGDENYWRERLSTPQEVVPVKDGQDLFSRDTSYAIHTTSFGQRLVWTREEMACELPLSRA